MIRDQIIEALKKVTGEKEVHLEFPEREEFGDYSTNVALQNKNKKPREYADEIVKKLQENGELKKIVEKIEVAGPGFINFYLSKDYLCKSLSEIDGSYGSSVVGKGKTVLVEYSSPNVAKRFSVGHLRSTIIGQALRNIFESLGYKTIGENHLGDWGTQFGMIIFQVIKNNLNPSELSVDDFQKLYVEFNTEAETNEKLIDEARGWFKKLEAGDSEAKKIWEAAVKISLLEFQKVYDLLGVKIENSHGESFYEDKMPEVIEEVRKKGLSKKSQGAEIVEFEKLPVAMLLKTDGTTTYFTRDLAAIKYRIKQWNPDIFIYEVGVEQKLHFEQVFEAAKMLGWTKDKKFVHIGHGLFLFEGSKMSTRKGNDIKLETILKEAIEKAYELSQDDARRGETIKHHEINKRNRFKHMMGEQEAKETSRMVGIGAIKYFELMHQPTSNINFDWNHIFNLEGNSGPYLQYTYARAKSVLDKGEKISDYDNRCEDTLYEEESAILRTLVKFPEFVTHAAETYSPNVICNYLYDLAQKYNSFYNKHKIIGSQKEEFRLSLTRATATILKGGISLLGFEAPEKM